MSKRNRKQFVDLPENIREPREKVHEHAKNIPISFFNRTQKAYGHLIETKDIVLSSGVAGSGKSHIAALYALKGFLNGEYERIVICRPAVEAGGEQIGFLPGEINEKLDPYIRPILDIFRLHIPMTRIKTMIEYGQLEILPLGFARGRTFRNSFVVVDEAQNCSVDLLFMILTRLGEGSKMVITGDPSQRDIKGESCFTVAYDRLVNIARVGFIQFSDKDVVRHPTVQKILLAWDPENSSEEDFETYTNGADKLNGSEKLPDFIRLGKMEK